MAVTWQLVRLTRVDDLLIQAPQVEPKQPQLPVNAGQRCLQVGRGRALRQRRVRAHADPATDNSNTTGVKPDGRRGFVVVATHGAAHRLPPSPENNHAPVQGPKQGLHFGDVDASAHFAPVRR